MKHETSIGIDLGGTKLLIATQNDINQSYPTGPAFTPSKLVKIISQFIQQHHLTVKTIGLAVPGIVEKNNHIILSDVLPAFSNWPAGRELSQTLSASVTVINDVKAALIEQAAFLPANTSIIVVMAGTAIGSAMMIEGKIINGASGWCGELGYTPFNTADKIVRLDEIAGGRFMAQQLNLSTQQFIHALANNNQAAQQIVLNGGKALGMALAGLINFINPHYIAVGGGTIELPGYWDCTFETAKQLSMPAPWEACQLKKINNHKVVALGALKYSQANIVSQIIKP